MNECDAGQSATPLVNDWFSKRHIQTLVLMVTTAFGIYLCYLLAIPFLSPLALALALAVLFAPFQGWLESRLKSRGVSAVVTVVVIGLIVIVPITFMGQRLAMEAIKGADLIETKIKSGEWRHALESRPTLAPFADRIVRQFDLPGIIKTFTTWLSNTAGTIVKGSVFQIIDICITFYLLFFFLRDRHRILLSLRFLSPLSKREMDQLFNRVGNTIFATIFGTVVVSAAQGLLGGLMFWWLGLSAPLFWGVVMMFLAVLPVLGAFVVWIPAALFLALEGNIVGAIILSLWGMFVVGTIDNLLRPILVGKRLKLHTVLAFISIVGGLILFGLAGLIIGPVVLTITTVLLETWYARNIHETRVLDDTGESLMVTTKGG